VGETSDDTEPGGSIDWLGLPSPAAIRAACGLLAAAGVALIGAFVLGEYEFEGAMPIGAGLLFGIVVGEVAVEIGRRRTVPFALACAGLAAGGLLWAGWIAAGEGLAPIPGGAWLAAGVGAGAAALRVVGLRRPGGRST
jgi:hypothetical protein